MSEVTYGAAIKSCSRAHEWKAALSVLSWMELADGVVSNEIAYSAAIKSFEGDGLWEEALALLFQMGDVSLQADIVCISAAIAASATAGQWQVALQLFQLLEKPENSATSAARKLLPDVVSLNTLISAMDSQWQLGIHILQDARRWLVTPNLITFNSAIKVCEKASEWQCAISIMEQASQASLVPGIVTFNSCISACQSSSWTISLQLLNGIATSRLSPDVISFTSAVSVISQAGLWQLSFSLIEDMLARRVDPNEVTYGALMVATVKSGEWPLSLRILDECQKQFDTPNSVIYNAAISALEKGYQWTLAVQLLQKMKSLDLADEISWNTAISACETCGQWEMAIQLLFTFLKERRKGWDGRAGRLSHSAGASLADSCGLITFNAAISACEKRPDVSWLNGCCLSANAKIKCKSSTLSFLMWSVRYNWSTRLPVVPHKAAAEVSELETYRREVGCCESRMAEGIHWLTERWLDLCLLEWLQWLQWSPHPQLLDWVWCSAAVVAM